MRALSKRDARPAAAETLDARGVIALCHAVLAERGEVSAARRAGEALAACRSLSDTALDAFFDALIKDFSPDEARVTGAAAAYQARPSTDNLILLQTAVESPRQELFRRFNMVPGGTAALVDLRRKLLANLAEHPSRAAIDADLVHLFRSWFNPGFLELRRIDWRTSATVLERLIQYEAVHQIQGWRDLRRRLEADRRCYAFFHPALPDEPLIFIEVALTQGMAAAVQPLLNADAQLDDPERADTAMFYSITNCQIGLRGVSFGNLLIKQAVEDLRAEFPRLRTFATISPLPGFVRWLETSPSRALVPGGNAAADTGVPESQRQQVIALAAYYLLQAKRGTAPLDPVARFHLANGARVERVNWMGDSSSNGMRQSLGVTVNYVYRLADVERQHEAFASSGKIAASHQMQALAKDAARHMK